MPEFASQACQRFQQRGRNDASYVPSLTLSDNLSLQDRNCISLKRERLASFDMSDILKASQQVEDSFAFPVIEWPSFDADSEEDDEFSAPPSKRQCRGLVRCDRSSNLYTLSAIATSTVSINAIVERQGSNGSLV
ncbi:hypothetical protein IV203_018032 [Nitzschia inconspicua]|uniref:Uncharacterized protein n=1 Tax=Nitzschia inconspicua TaxID=303405 RepID=A0A9K3Q644_9STRA|nr:hypothetical protein IV203_018032 [Nitzschia inconspicua]